MEEICVLCGKEIPVESGKQYCKDCEELYLKNNEKEAIDYGYSTRSEN